MQKSEFLAAGAGACTMCQIYIYINKPEFSFICHDFTSPLSLTMQLRVCQALIMLRMNTAAPSPPPPTGDTHDWLTLPEAARSHRAGQSQLPGPPLIGREVAAATGASCDWSH